MGNLFYIGGTDRIAFRDYDEAVKWCKNRTPWNEEQIKEKIMKCNFKDEVQKLCDMKIAVYSNIKDGLTDNLTDKEICAMFRKCLKESPAFLQMVKVANLRDEVEAE